MPDLKRFKDTTRFPLGLRLTNECSLGRAFCCRDLTRTERLTLARVQDVMGRLPVRSVNLGTSRNGMHPEFGAMVSHLRSQPEPAQVRRAA